MISSAATATSSLVLIFATLFELPLVTRASSLDERTVYTIDAESAALAASQGDQRHENAPGHYQFEVAPKLVPPSIKWRPPYSRSSQQCASSDLYGGFSPRDTLCGDLNQGRVPMNPLGQSIQGESYPFELIKNKTLQFLSRALPILKLEYESIPKVARYLPTNQLLNPTTNEHLNQRHLLRINRRQSAGLSPSMTGQQGGFASLQGDALYGIDGELANGGYLNSRRRRRKRDTTRRSDVTIPLELQSNATLVVHSAHSGVSLKSHPGSHGRIITVYTDNEKLKRHQQSVPSRILAAVATSSASGGSSTKQTTTTTTRADYASRHGSLNSQHFVDQQEPGATGHVELGGSQSSPQQQQQQQQQVATEQQVLQQRQAHVQARSASEQQSAKLELQESGLLASQIQDKKGANASTATTTAAAATTTTTTTTTIAPLSGSKKPATKRKLVQTPSPSSSQTATPPASGSDCSTSANVFNMVLCQAVSALVEGSQKPNWMRIAQQLGSLYSTNPADSWASWVSPQASGDQHQPEAKNSNQPTRASGTQLLVNLLSYLTNGKLSQQPANDQLTSRIGHTSKEQQVASPYSALADNWVAKFALAGWVSNALAGLYEHLPIIYQSINSISGNAKRRKAVDAQDARYVDTPASSKLVDTPAPSKLVKQPPTPCQSTEEYISPTFARNYQGAWKYVVQIPHEGYFTQTIQRTSCLKQKCDFTEGTCHESPRWVSLLVAEIYYPNAVFNPTLVQKQQQQQQQQQVAEASELHAISAAASGGLPASSAIESIFQQLPEQQQRQLLYAHNVAQLQQQQQPGKQVRFANGPDPMQMIDTNNDYNHNSAANWDSPAMQQQLAQWLSSNNNNNNHYQMLSQRQGLQGDTESNHISGESRASSVASPVYLEAPANAAQHQSQPQQRMATTAAAPQVSPQVAASRYYQQQQQQHQKHQQQQYNSAFQKNQDYIIALAAAALQQNPNMNINELLASLQLQVAADQTNRRRRKRRDLSAQATQAANIATRPIMSGQQLSGFTPTSNVVGQTKPTQLDALSPLNDITSNHLNGQQQQAQMQQQQALGGSSQQQVECDGHDKIGCYVVRVYYDWFLVNGSCKCWKTSLGSNSQSGPTSASNSFLRRIFTG